MLTEQRKREQGTTSFAQIDFDDPTSVASFASSIWRRRHYFKHHLERQWFLNIAWYMGQQNLVWSDLAKNLINPKVPPWRVRMIVNLMMGAIRTNAAKIHKGQPEWDVLPATADILDQQVAELDKHVLRNYWQVCGMPAKVLERDFWLLLTGNAFLKIVWDPERGDDIDVTPQDLMESEGTLATDLEKYSGLKLGDVAIEVKSPFDIIVDPLATKMDNTLWLMESNIQYVHEIKERWGKIADGIAPEATTLGVGDTFNYHRKLQQLNSNQSSVLSPNDYREDSAVVHELWIKPHGKGKFKNGRMLVICQDKVLNGNGKGVEFPYEHKKIPYVHYFEVFVPGRFWGASTCENLIPLQADYNKTKSQLIENRNLMTRPKWLLPEGSNVSSDTLNDEPGEVIQYTPINGLEPKPLQMPGMPSYVNNMLQEHRQDFEDVSGQHEASKAEAPGQVRSGKGVIALIQQDESRLGTLVEHIDIQEAEVGKLLLQTVCQYVEEERIAKITGVNDELMVFAFKGNQLLGKNYGRPGANYFDVRIKTIPGMPKSRLAQMQLVETFIEKQFLGPNDKDLVFRMLGIGNIQDTMDKSRVHRSNALLENRKLMQGEQVQVFTYQDHIAHLEVLDEFRNSIEYSQLPEEIKQLFMLHEQQHKMAQAMKMAEPQVLLQRAQQQLMMANNVGAPSNGQEQQQRV